MTWPLWLKAGGFPKIALVSFASDTPVWIESAVLLVLFCSLSTLPFRPHQNLVSSSAFVCAAVALIVIDQHRLQPWLWQMIILQLFVISVPKRLLVTYARLLLISIYVFSAISKFDYQFLHTIGQQFSDVTLSNFGVEYSKWDVEARAWTASLFPVAEFIVGLGLLFQQTRKVSTWAAILLHVVLIAILGPWGLGHQAGVLVWNALFIVLVAILFLRQDSGHDTAGDPPANENEEVSPRWSTRMATGLILLPLLEPFGLLDHWPAWQLYAPRNSRAEMSVLTSAVPKLPAELRPYAQSEANSIWQRVDLQRWTVDARKVPIYPQDRFQLGVAAHIATKSDLAGAVRVVQQGPSSRWDGKRKEQTFRGTEEIIEAAKRFRLNALPE